VAQQFNNDGAGWGGLITLASSIFVIAQGTTLLNLSQFSSLVKASELLFFMGLAFIGQAR